MHAVTDIPNRNLKIISLARLRYLSQTPKMLVLDMGAADSSVLFLKKKYGPAEIRTQDLRHVKATS
ncbi:hypothetical protein, partial [uncultured Methanofollis sp.]|uniref:hypothetical protein n=1 Tax=uncultured Methanofollis sp. TaxID=262500 RepID=UPI00261698A6